MFISDSLFYFSLIKDSRGRDESPGRLLGLGTLSLAPVMAVLVKNGDRRVQREFAPGDIGKARWSFWRGIPDVRALLSILCYSVSLFCVVVKDRWRPSAFYSFI